MIIFLLFILGCICWFSVFMGWWFPWINILLIISGGLLIYWLIELMFFKKRNAIILLTFLIYINIIIGVYAHDVLEIQGMTRFILLSATSLSAVVFVGYIRNGQDGDRNQGRLKEKKSLKSFFNERKKKQDNSGEITIFLGESAEENREENVSSQ